MLLVVLDKYSLFWPTVDVNGPLTGPHLSIVITMVKLVYRATRLSTHTKIITVTFMANKSGNRQTSDSVSS